MTTLTYPAPSGAAGTLRAIGAFFSNFADGVREGREIRDRYNRLSRLSDTQLKRRGLDRSQIAQAAARGLEVA